MIKVTMLFETLYFDTMKDVYDYFNVSNENELEEFFDDVYRDWGMEAPGIEVIN